MKFTCELERLASAIALVARVSETGAQASGSASTFKIEVRGTRVLLTATDLSTTISSRINVRGAVDGTYVVPAGFTNDLVRALGGDTVEVESSEDEPKLIVSSGATRVAINRFGANEFPTITELAGPGTTVNAEELFRAFRAVSPAASTDVDRAQLTAVRLERVESGMRAVATDSYRLGVTEVAADVLEGGDAVLVPASVLRLVMTAFKDADTIDVRLSERNVTFASEDTRITSALTEGQFPSYEALIPSNEAPSVVFAADELLEVLARARLAVKSTPTPVRLCIRPDGVTLTSERPEIGQVVETLATADVRLADEMTIAFNPHYLSEAVVAIGADKIMFSMRDTLKPVLVRGEGSPVRYVVMPVRV